LLYLVLTSGILSALLVNDTVCLMLTPLVVAVMVRGNLPLPPYLLALAMSANLGSVATWWATPEHDHWRPLPDAFLEFSGSLLAGGAGRVSHRVRRVASASAGCSPRP
jgi:hypothetical protein